MSGAIAGGVMIFVGRWSLGLDLDFYTLGTSGRLGLGPVMLRWYAGSGGGFFYCDRVWRSTGDSDE